MKIIALLFLFCGFSAFGQGATEVTNHYDILKQAAVFSLSGGFAGRITREGEAVLAVAKQKNAVAMFSTLAHEDSPSAKLYGLLGLQMISSPQFRNELPKLLKNKTPVRVLEGCIMGTKEIAVVAREIEQGRWSLGLNVKVLK